MHLNVAVLGGDGIGPEVVAEAVKVLQRVCTLNGHSLETHPALVGGAAIEAEGDALSDVTLDLCRTSDAILFGAVGLPKYDQNAGPAGSSLRPEKALFALRKTFDLFANLRPVQFRPALADSVALKPEVVAGVDMVVVRELTGGLYFGKPSERRVDKAGVRHAVDTMPYSAPEIERICRVAFDLARSRAAAPNTVRKPRVTSVDKSNVLNTSRLWREVATEVGQDYPDVELEHMLVDTAAMNLIRRPAAFDVIVTENMFGDILTDEASMLAGSMGMLASASLGTRVNDTGGRFGLYEPIHGSAPDITGQGIANPVAAILCVALMLRQTFGLHAEAATVERAVEMALSDGFRTADIALRGSPAVTTTQMGDAVAGRLDPVEV